MDIQAWEAILHVNSDFCKKEVRIFIAGICVFFPLKHIYLVILTS